MKILGIDYEDGAVTSVQVTTDGKDRMELAPVRHGHWINGCYTAPIMPETDVCSECGLRLVYGLNFKYCPFCGSIMDEVSE